MASLFFIGISIASCGETTSSNPFSRPRPGESGLLMPGGHPNFQLKETTERVLFVTLKDTGNSVKPVSLHIDSVGGGRATLVLTSSPSNIDCLNGNKNIETFMMQNQNLKLVCDPSVVRSLPSTMMASLHFSDGTAKILTGISASRARIDNFEVVVVNLDP